MAVPKNLEKDEVVGSMDLLVSRSAGRAELYLMQYPLRSNQAGIGSDRPVLGMRVRPNQRRLQLRVSMYPEAPERGIPDEDGFCSKSFDERKEDKMPNDKCQILESSKETIPRANYAAARYLSPEEGESGQSAIVLCPIHSVTQMTPTFKHIDEKNIEEMKKKKSKTTDGGVASGGEEVQEVEPVQVGVKYRKRETEWAAARRKKSHAHLMMTEEAEPWKELSFNAKSSSEAHESMTSLFVPQTLDGIQIPKISIDLEEYKQRFQIRSHAKTTNVKSEDGLEGSDGMQVYLTSPKEPLSLQEARTLPVSTAIPRMLRTARVLPFSRIKEMMTEDTDPKVVLETLRRCARLIRSCWVFQSTSTKEKRLIALRDIILSCFRQNRIVKTPEVMAELGEAIVSLEFVKSVLLEVATYQATVGWEFKYDDGDDFDTHHHDIAEWQNKEWERRLSVARSQIL
eukprot:Plantae.Rhodophyta-Hildenbrandia_rubra.ctg820.p1 GENE.Plantae.Rhodophyta-Hildenbrandia_rubra.ctg820~~Plantae.Rhodophyta-Hildenbrandia_rubra.ctg820.p1  ORF type:complete len:456 (-),score=95.06 Plantae.Rhodophyta-Hildenbrandia_rubra.ctg820:1939-3306(-)